MRLVLVASAIAAVSLAGCGRNEEKTEGKEAKPALVAIPGGYAARSKDGTVRVLTGGAAANAKAPDYAPLYPGAVVDSTMAGVGDADSRRGTIIYKVDAPPEKVIAFYKDKATAAGFTSELDSNMGAAHMFAAKREASGEAMQVVASTADKGSSVQVIWATKSK